jgi:hypothetical protein
LLIGRKPNISYFRVFGCKCYILKKGTRLSKFQSKCDEGFLLGYSSCSKAYRVYNKTHGIVEEAYDVEFDETNGSHNEQENLDDVRSDGLRNAMKNMSIGDVRPREEDESDDGHSISIRVNPSTSISNDQAQQIVHLLHQLKNPLFLKELIIFLQRITPWIKLWVILVRVSKLDLALLHFVNIILLYLFLNLTV